MRRKIVFIALVATMFCSATAYAQKVVTEGSGETIKVIIDATGMPSGAITTTKKPRTTTATNSTACTQDATDLASKVNNEKVYHRFEVSKTDNDGGTATNWLTAFNYCKDATINGTTGWRLPTQRELMLIWILKPVLEKQSNFNLFSDKYLCATEINISEIWHVGFGTGPLTSKAKTTTTHVRCVRDI